MERKGHREGLPWTALAEMERYYRDRLPFHDQYMGYEGSDEMERLLGPVIRLIEQDVAGRDVLEVACGTGNWTQVLARRARTVVATDLIGECLELARRKVPEGGNVTFKAADAYSLEGPEGSFDAAFAADWWSHMPRSMVGPFLESLHRRLRPGARVVMVDMMRSESFDLAFHRIDAEGNEVQMRTLPDGGPYLVVKNFPEEDELRCCLEGMATDVRYHVDTELRRWVLRYALPD
jgi:demethylmenaquinone methyltransferase/2-methoxy-6-polyprenyl-1,4-benzoquinol methylase